ncbi:MAG TPA: CopD family protein [Candidatus Binatia bacterium]|nr:CopD family protein [Candidatus Binatia bacterium]
MGVALPLHVLSAVIWVGGMFFALIAMRPAAAGLDDPSRARVWATALGLFFRWVWLAVALLLVTGLWMTFGVLGGLRAAGPHVHAMLAIGVVMMLMAAHVYFAPLRRLRAGEDAARSLAQIRLFMAVNLALGLLVIAIASGGRYWFHR